VKAHSDRRNRETRGAGAPTPLTPVRSAAPDPYEPYEPPVPRLLCDTSALTALVPAPAGALWKLAEPGRQLDANLVHLPPHQHVDLHVEPDLDVLLLVVAGTGTLGAEPPAPPQPLTEGALVWLPHGAARSLAADDRGLSYLTVHRRRPGMRIGPRPAD
jgi:quercetin dioxygenase-like cupin family protein